ncbi:cytochrome C oxidase subunit II [Methylomarinum sp. Ch1-1]|uniref:Cytochrome C oxidase subunit II n=1 Tax=Methylomarinum roseum TaxID=3067653 RepID=A0AAU7NRF7_9GAMM|nr:cytochrome C oxidase subunit II [Methylomarinum sp. Ch1-1]MDP4520808.1 cytochrome C oxidase subunit II [Methylomarinum sp. Ch1-1]
MHIDPLEKQWAQIVLAICGLFVTLIIIDALFHNITTPGNVETIDSASLHLSEEFAEDNLGVHRDENGNVSVKMVAGRYSFFPKEISVPAETNITFRWVSIDVLHGVHVPMTNMSTMIVPGFVAELQTSFPKPGDYPMLCNEYCGLGHDHMWGRIDVVEKDQWHASKQTTNGAAGNER